jgi:hypothetical protein
MNLNEKHWTKDLKEKYPKEDIRNPFFFISGESFGKVDEFPFNTPRRSNDIILNIMMKRNDYPTLEGLIWQNILGKTLIGRN